MSPRTHERELTPAAVARILGRDPRTIRKWIEWGHLRARKIRTAAGAFRYFIAPAEIERSRRRSETQSWRVRRGTTN
jgi:hypothetical protein